MEDRIIMGPAVCNGRATILIPMKSKPTPIDLDKLRARIRRLGLEQAFLMLDEALGMLSQAQLHRLAKR